MTGDIWRQIQIEKEKEDREYKELMEEENNKARKIIQEAEALKKNEADEKKKVKEKKKKARDLRLAKGSRDKKGTPRNGSSPHYDRWKSTIKKAKMNRIRRKGIKGTELRAKTNKAVSNIDLHTKRNKTTIRGWNLMKGNRFLRIATANVTSCHLWDQKLSLAEKWTKSVFDVQHLLTGLSCLRSPVLQTRGKKGWYL